MLGLFRGVGFVGCDKYWLLRSANNLGKFLVVACKSVPAIEHENHGCTLLEGQFDLLSDLRFELVFRACDIPTGVNYGKVPARPLRISIMTIARHTGLIVHDSLPLL